MSKIDYNSTELAGYDPLKSSADTLQSSQYKAVNMKKAIQSRQYKADNIKQSIGLLDSKYKAINTKQTI